MLVFFSSFILYKSLSKIVTSNIAAEDGTFLNGLPLITRENEGLSKNRKVLTNFIVIDLFISCSYTQYTTTI